MQKRSLLWIALLAGPLLTFGCAPSADVPVDGYGVGSGSDGKFDDPDVHDGPPPSLVELKLTIDASSLFEVLRAFEPDRDDLQRRSITFHDTPELALFEHGLVLRSRKVRDDLDDSTVKIRPMSAAEAYSLTPEYFAQEGFKCELDWTLTNEVSSCSYSVMQRTGEIEAVAAGTRTVDRLFSRQQESLFDAFAPPGITINDTVPLGPVTTIRFRKVVDALDLRITVELWSMPNGALLIELSTRVDAEDAETQYALFQAWVEDSGMLLAEVQGTKTGRVLDYFASEF